MLQRTPGAVAEQPRTRPGHLAVLVCLVAVGIVATYFSIHTLWLASTRSSSLPSADIWWFFLDYFKYVDGSYSFWHLFDRHNEHVIFFGRLALFADTIWFHASGKLVLVVTYLLLGATALMIAYLAARPVKWQVNVIALALLGIFGARIQMENLTLPFQLQFFLVHAFAVAFLIAFCRGMTAGWRWYAVAAICDFGAVFSLGTGVLVGVSAVAVAVWKRRLRCLIGFLPFHAVLVAVFASRIYAGPAPGHPLPALGACAVYFFTFLGNFLAAYPAWIMPVGIGVTALVLGLCLWLAWRATAQISIGDEAVILVAIALFVLLEAGAAVMARAQYGIGQALALRYTTCTLLLVAALFALAWRLLPQSPCRVAALLMLAVVTCASNNVMFENGWLQHTRRMDGITAEIAKGIVRPESTKYLTVTPDVFDKVIWRFKAAELGPFRDR
jgi:hypothetical protein